ncbi:MAG: YraN family protein [Acidimicrobiales bacterium]
MGHDYRRRAGADGEKAAAAWYSERGYEVVAANWRRREGEIDLVCSRGRWLVFCEVKSRSRTAFGSPLEAVTAAKQARLRRLAALYLREAAEAACGTWRPARVRFDVAAVTRGVVEVTEAAF